ncbi:MAG: PEGA domain-containing protein [Pseudohongiellaceae bacterium]
MVDVNDGKREGRHDQDDELITPVDFTPPPAAGRQWSLRPRLWHGLVALFLVAAVGAAWFVLTARSVFIETTPVTADVDISGGLAVQVGPRYLIRPGDYRLSLRNEGYHDLDTLLSVSGAQAQTHEAVMQPMHGFVTLRATDEDGEPLDGVRARLDGRDIGELPLESLEVEPGEYRVTLDAERYLPRQEVIEVEGRLQEQHVELSLQPAWADIRFATDPSGADVLVDGEVVGQTPLTASLMQGERQVTLKRSGYKAVEETLRVVAGEERERPVVSLEEADGLVFIRSEPSGANVTINGEFRGQTPLEVSLEPDQRHEISLFRAGYATADRELTARSAEQADLNVTLDPQTAPVRIAAEPPDAEVYVDGERRGTAGDTLELLAAEQQVEIRRDGYVPHVQAFTARPGLDQEIRVSLQTEEEARIASIEPEIETAAGQVLRLFRPDDYTMGASRREPGRRANEALRDVVMEKPFYLALHPVTNAQFQRFRPDHEAGSVEGQSLDLPRQPVVQVSWIDAALYANWLSEQESLLPFYRVEDEEVVGVNPDATGYRLPTEAEWEWAARSDGEGNIRRYPWGDTWPPPENAGNFADQSTRSFLGQILSGYNDGEMVTSNVGRYEANALGLYDMAGNVSEWVHDHYRAVSGLSTAAEIDPLGPGEGSYRTVKGSSWMHGAMTELRASFRDFAEEPRNDLGFRLARYLGE